MSEQKTKERIEIIITYIGNSYGDETGRSNALYAIDELQKILINENKLPACEQICPNCESPLPEGCGGIFKDESACKFIGEKQ